MKTEFKAVKPKEAQITKFPTIGILKDGCKSFPDVELAVLFTEPEQGIVIHSVNARWEFGHICSDWSMYSFRSMRPGEEIIIKG